MLKSLVLARTICSMHLGLEDSYYRNYSSRRLLSGVQEGAFFSSASGDQIGTLKHGDIPHVRGDYITEKTASLNFRELSVLDGRIVWQTISQ